MNLQIVFVMIRKVINGTLDESLKVMKLIEEIYSDDSEWYNKYVK